MRGSKENQEKRAVAVAKVKRAIGGVLVRDALQLMRMLLALLHHRQARAETEDANVMVMMEKGWEMSRLRLFSNQGMSFTLDLDCRWCLFITSIIMKRI